MASRYKIAKPMTIKKAKELTFYWMLRVFQCPNGLEFKAEVKIVTEA